MATSGDTLQLFGQDWRPGPIEFYAIQTTEKYLGMQQNLVEAVNDKLGIVDAEEEY